MSGQLPIHKVSQLAAFKNHPARMRQEADRLAILHEIGDQLFINDNRLWVAAGVPANGQGIIPLLVWDDLVIGSASGVLLVNERIFYRPKPNNTGGHGGLRLASNSDLKKFAYVLKQKQRNGLSQEQIAYINSFFIPVDNLFPQRDWIVCLAGSSQMPTYEELRMVRNYTVYKINTFGGKEWIRKKIMAPLAESPGYNTVVLCKRNIQDSVGWHYRRKHWSREPLTHPRPELPDYFSHTLPQLINHVEGSAFKVVLPETQARLLAWDQWTAGRPDIWRPQPVENTQEVALTV